MAATELLGTVLGRSAALDGLLDPRSGLASYRALDDRDRRLAHALASTALRHLGEIDAVLARLVEKAPWRRAGPLRQILRIAAAQILFMGVADHAAVSTAVDQVAGDKDAVHFKGLANAVLRRMIREREQLLASLDPDRLDTPDWLWRRWLAAYGEPTARRIAAMHRVEPYLDLSARSDPAALAEAVGGVFLPTGTVRLTPSGPVDALPGFAEGGWWVQDAAAALVPKLLGDVAGKRVADLCAAPGGKTAALATAGAEVTAVDISAERLRRLSENLVRLHLSAEIFAADILEWRPDKSRAAADRNREPVLFDAVLLDAPCSATGTIRRHPDIVWLKTADDIAALAKLQGAMLERVAGWVRPGGLLVYATCSLEPEEGEAQIARFLARHPFTRVPVEAAEVGGLAEIVTPAGDVRTLPSHLASDTPRLAGLDGFFMARLRRN
jgi:16S rRNA (cytosine967-C5)-methyltransferase